MRDGGGRPQVNRAQRRAALQNGQKIEPDAPPEVTTEAIAAALNDLVRLFKVMDHAKALVAEEETKETLGALNLAITSVVGANDTFAQLVRRACEIEQAKAWAKVREMVSFGEVN